MDEPNNSLMGMHGYCTQELVHLLILGGWVGGWQGGMGGGSTVP